MTAAQRSTAYRLLKKHGQIVSIVGGTPGGYDPVTGTVTNGSYNKSCWAALFPIGHFAKVDGSNIKAGDEQLLVAGIDVAGATLPEPPINSVVTLKNGTTRTLTAFNRLNHDGVGEIIYDCIVRGNA